MATRSTASQCTREDLRSLIEGRLSTSSAKDELVKLATRLIVEEAPDIWVYNTVEYVPLAKTVQGFTFSLVGSGQDFWPVYFDPQA